MTCWVVLSCVAAWGIAQVVAICLTCRPFEKSWNPTLPGRCIDLRPQILANGAINMVFDLIIFVLPIRSFWGLKLPKNKRIGLVLVFGIGSV